MDVKTIKFRRASRLVCTTPAMVAVLSATGCGGDSDSDPSNKDTVVIAVPSDPGSLDPHASPSSTNLQ